MVQLVPSVGHRSGLADGDGVADAELEGDADGEAEADGLMEGDGDAEGEWEGDWDGVTVGSSGQLALPQIQYGLAHTAR